MFKPFIFVPQVQQFVSTASPVLGSDDPVKLNPRFQTSPDRRHELYKKHESALRSMETSQVDLSQFIVEASVHHTEQFNFFIKLTDNFETSFKEKG